MSVSLYVRVGGIKVDATAIRLNAYRVDAIQKEWRTDHPRYVIEPQGWSYYICCQLEWKDLVGVTSPVYGLFLGKGERCMGMIALDFEAETAIGESCVGIDLIAKSPLAKNQRVTGVASALIGNAIQIRIEKGFGGKACIGQAKGKNPHANSENPMEIYKKIGFVSLSVDMWEDGVECGPMEISEKDAKDFLERWGNGS